MFESAGRDEWADLTVHPVAALVALAEANQDELKERENRVLRLAAAWADAFPGDPRATSPLLERGMQLGGEGTPVVSEFAATELAPLLGKSHGGARALIADVLDIRHRLPRLWQLVETARVHGWQARRIAQATRVLSPEAAGEVDQALAGYVGQLGWTRFERLLEAAVLAADPVLAEQRTVAARRDRGVWSTGAQDGQKTIVARTDSSTATWFMATIDRIAAALAAEGDTDTADLRRSKALGWLAQPAGALDLLMRHTDDDDPINDVEPEPEESTASEPRPSAGDQVPDDIDSEHAAHGIRLSAPARFDAAKARPEGGAALPPLRHHPPRQRAWLHRCRSSRCRDGEARAWQPDHRRPAPRVPHRHRVHHQDPAGDRPGRHRTDRRVRDQPPDAKGRPLPRPRRHLPPTPPASA